MHDLISTLINSDLEELLGDLYQPVCACIVASWSILSFGAVCSAFTHIFSAVLGGGRK